MTFLALVGSLISALLCYQYQWWSPMALCLGCAAILSLCLIASLRELCKKESRGIVWLESENSKKALARALEEDA